MEIKESLNLLQDMFKSQEWFAGTGTDEFGKLVVYCKYLNVQVWNSVPVKLGDRDVLTHFATATQNLELLSPQIFEEDPLDVDDLLDVKIPDVASLVRELERLEKICGSNILQDIFYEIHDGKNAVTNLRARYPEVATPMQDLYQTYGFDVIYEELDG
jgi:hypothetical protein